MRRRSVSDFAASFSITAAQKLWFHEIAPAVAKITGYAVAYSTEVGGAVNTGK
jgi:hypothetical protein